MSTNPMREARAALALHPTCGAHCRTTGQPCKAPSMANGRCRMHGGGSPGAPSGKSHPNYRHGKRTRAEREERRAVRDLLRTIRELCGAAGEES